MLGLEEHTRHNHLLGERIVQVFVNAPVWSKLAVGWLASTARHQRAAVAAAAAGLRRPWGKGSLPVAKRAAVSHRWHSKRPWAL